MTSLRPFVICLAIVFLLPWWFLIAQPHSKMRKIEPVLIDPEDATQGVYPAARSNVYRDGEVVFAREGCANCHTQVIRPTYMGLDSFKQGWGREQKELTHTRETRPEDYIGDRYAFIGIQRNGPDLANAGYRFTDPVEVHTHLYNPRQFKVWSSMPSYRHLYTERKVQGDRSVEALDLKGEMAPKDGYEVVPTEDARALVDYIMTLKRDSTLPLSEQPSKTEKPAGGTSGEDSAS